MSRKKTPKCKIGFPCGRTCISKRRKCFANLSASENRLAETFSQFVNRLIGIQDGPAFVATTVPEKPETPQRKYIKDLSEDDYKEIKNLKRYVEGIYEVLLTPEGKEQKFQLEQGLDNLYEKLRYLDGDYWAANNSPLLEGIDSDRWNVKNYEARLKATPEMSSMTEIVEKKVKPLRGLLEERLTLGDEYGKSGDSEELQKRYQENSQKIKDLLAAGEEVYDDLIPPWRFSLQRTILDDLAFSNFPRIKDGNIYDFPIKELSEKTRGLSDVQKEDLLSFDLDEESILKIDSVYQERKKTKERILSEWVDVEGEILKKKEEMENFISTLDSQINKKTPDESSYNRQGFIDDKIKSRNLPEGNPEKNPGEAHLQKLINERAPMMAIGAKNLRELLSGDGEFKNIYDFVGKKRGIAATSGANYERYKSYRKQRELEAFNVPQSAKPEDRPVYGFMGNFRDLSYQLDGSLLNYGEIILEFKPEIKDGITVTIDDSLGATSAQKGSPANRVSSESVPNNLVTQINLDAKDHRTIYDSGPDLPNRTPRYIEWQSGGRLTITDLSRIYLPINVYLSLPKKVQKQLEDLGIELFLITPKKIDG